MTHPVKQIEDAVWSRLVCPTTVTFGDFRAAVSRGSRQVYTFYVDARGYYGALTRTYWIAEVAKRDVRFVREFDDAETRDTALALHVASTKAATRLALVGLAIAVGASAAYSPATAVWTVGGCGLGLLMYRLYRRYRSVPLDEPEAAAQ